MPASPEIVLLVSGSELGRIVANDIARHFPRVTVIEEAPESKLAVIRRRRRLVGLAPALSQAACGILVRVLGRLSRRRIARLCELHGLYRGRCNRARLISVPSVNSDACRQALAEIGPAVVAVYGTRILSQRTLAATPAPFINYHAGINPKYRGQHPAYWALAQSDPDHAGITVHLVDEGVDTGDVLYQQRVGFGRGDTIATYQYVQMAAALPLFRRAIADAIAGRLKPGKVALPSRQWFPPTLGQYLVNGCLRGVW